MSFNKILVKSSLLLFYITLLSLLVGCQLDDDPDDNVVIINEIIQADDVEIKVNSFNYWEGSVRYRRKFNDLTPQQIEALEGLEPVSDMRDYCVPDGDNIEIELTNSAGEKRTYFSFFKDGDCGFFEIDREQRVSFISIMQFIQTYDCLSASDARYGGETVEDALEVNTDDGCELAFFGGPTWLKVNITKPGDYVFRGLECGSHESTFTLYAEDGETIINEGIEEDDPGCWVIEQTLDEPGYYYLLVDGNYGDYFVRITSE